MFRYFLPIAISLALSGGLMAQQMIELKNPSFEGVPGTGIIPPEWNACGDDTNSPPDTQPGEWGVDNLAREGRTYLGLVVRDNGTWEGVSQRLDNPLLSGHCYKIAMDLARSATFNSYSVLAGGPTQFTTPVCVRIWGGNDHCERSELLVESSLIKNIGWCNYVFFLQPEDGNYDFIHIEAFYNPPTIFHYNGHVLVDNLSPISLVSCE